MHLLSRNHLRHGAGIRAGLARSGRVTRIAGQPLLKSLYEKGKNTMDFFLKLYFRGFSPECATSDGNQ
jgi:hypothetical protein